MMINRYTANLYLHKLRKFCGIRHGCKNELHIKRLLQKNNQFRLCKYKFDMLQDNSHSIEERSDIVSG